MHKKATEEEIQAYRDAYKKGETTTKKIAEAKHVSLSTAKRWLDGVEIEAPDPTHPKLNWVRVYALELASMLFSVVSLAAAFMSISMNVKLQHDVAAEKAISDSYATFYSLDRMAMDHRSVSHLFAGPKYYQTVRAQVTLASTGSTPAQMAGFLLEDRQAASFIFDYFEEIVLQHQHAVESGDDEQLRYLNITLSYLTDSALKNPRLLWYWSPTGGDLSSDYDAKTIAYYQSHVATPTQSLQSCDPTGPFTTQPTPLGHRK